LWWLQTKLLKHAFGETCNVVQFTEQMRHRFGVINSDARIGELFAGYEQLTTPLSHGSHQQLTQLSQV
jgi:hypothetical protein